MTIRRVIIDSSAPVWAKHLETDLNGALTEIGSDVQTARDKAASGLAAEAAIARAAEAAAASNAVIASRLPAGSVVNSAYAEYTAATGVSVVIPLDDTIPQVTEGTQILSAAITPTSSINKLRFRFQATVGVNAANWYLCAAFVNGGANAVAAQAAFGPTATGSYPAVLEYEYTPGTTSAQTVTIRVGPPINTVALMVNGTGTARQLGGAQRATLVLEEIKV